MRVFVTGASGHIGSAVIPELLGNGHQVVGLARSEGAAAKVAALGAEVRRGDLDDLAGLTAAAAEADGVIHLAFDHDLTRTGQMALAAQGDANAIRAFAQALAGTDKPLVTTSGALILALSGLGGRTGTEDDVITASGPRVDSENLTVALAEQGVRSSVIRLAPMVHSDLDKHGFTPSLIEFARKNGFAAYIGEGANRWPARRHVRHRRAVPPRTGEGPGRIAAARRVRLGHRVPDRRRDDRRPARDRGPERHPGGGAAVPRLPRGLRRARRGGVEHQDPRTARLGADPPELGPGRALGALLRLITRPHSSARVTVRDRRTSAIG